ncbi:MAG: hypothetical protein WC551_00365 [Patescibacteria group bacterium]
MFFDEFSSGHAGLFVGRFAVASAAEKKDRPKADFAGQKCLALKDDGTVCGTVISAHNSLPWQVCKPCNRRNVLRGRKKPLTKTPDAGV